MPTLKSVSCAAAIAAGAAVALIPGLAQAQQKFPTKPVRLAVGYVPGGSSESLARLIGGNWEKCGTSR